MPDKFYYICNHRKMLKDKACTGEFCKFKHKDGACERTSNAKYAKNKYNPANFKFVYHDPHNDTDYFSEINDEGEYF